MIVKYTAILKNGETIPFAGRFDSIDDFKRFVNHEKSSLGHNWKDVMINSIIE